MIDNYSNEVMKEAICAVRQPQKFEKGLFTFMDSQRKKSFDDDN